MNTRSRVLFAILATCVVAVLVGYVMLHNHAPFTREDYIALFTAIVLAALMVFLIVDSGVSLEMRIPRHLRALGHGYGLFDTLSSMVRQVEEVRGRVKSGALTAAEGDAQEGQLFESFHRYFSDQRWKQVDRLRRKGNEEAARKLAHEIGQSHQLLQPTASGPGESEGS